MPGRTIANGYGKHHRQLRAQYARRMQLGEIFRCWRCRLPINPRGPWDLGHDDADRSVYRGPEHVTCNRSVPMHRRRRGATPAPRRWLL